MNKTALRIVARDRILWVFATTAGLGLALVWATMPTLTALFWTAIYLGGFGAIFSSFYSVERDSITRTAQILAYTEQLERESKARDEEWSRRHEEFLASLDEEAERADLEDEILREDHERRMLEIEVTGKDPGPSGRAARIRAEREARATASAARARMDRKARMAARQSGTTATADEAAA